MKCRGADERREGYSCAKARRVPAADELGVAVALSDEDSNPSQSCKLLISHLTHSPIPPGLVDKYE